MLAKNQTKMNKDNVTKWYENRYLVILLIIGGFFAVFGIGNFFSENSSINVSGKLTLHTSSFDKGKSCRGDGGYSDIHQGSQVTVSNGGGDIITVSDLGEGLADEYGDCIFNFQLKDIPNAKVYQIEIVRRGKIVYEKQQLKEKDYRIGISIGE